MTITYKTTDQGRGKVKKLANWATSKGYEIAWGPVEVVENVRREIEDKKIADEFESQFYSDWLSGFTYLENPSIREPRSVIVVAVSRPAHLIAFTLKNGSYFALVPPQYVAEKKIRKEMRDELADGPLLGHNVAVLSAPLKAIAARLGLVSYGRNNIAYTSRFGSYLQLVGLITDAELVSQQDWESIKPKEMEACHSCDACIAACPTGAIDEDRFLLHADRCLTLHTESTAEFPLWVDSLEHSCLLGCMDCQQVCPANTGLLKKEFSGVTFTSEETDQLLGTADAIDNTSDGEIFSKLEKISLEEYTPIIGRNFKALIR